jgi:hypothetical protein
MPFLHCSLNTMPSGLAAAVAAVFAVSRKLFAASRELRLARHATVDPKDPRMLRPQAARVNVFLHAVGKT